MVKILERHGFIRNMMDVKVLILCVMSRVLYPVDEQKIYELCYQDECLSYFDVCEAVPQLEKSGHLQQVENHKYCITEKGKEDCALTEDSLAYPVMQRAIAAVERFNREIRRQQMIHTEILPRSDGDYSVIMGLDGEFGNLMTLELMAPNQQQARKLAATFYGKAESLFKTVMTELLEEAEGKNNLHDREKSQDTI